MCLTFRSKEGKAHFKEKVDEQVGFLPKVLSKCSVTVKVRPWRAWTTFCLQMP